MEDLQYGVDELGEIKDMVEEWFFSGINNKSATTRENMADRLDCLYNYTGAGIQNHEDLFDQMAVHETKTKNDHFTREVETFEKGRKRGSKDLKKNKSIKFNELYLYQDLDFQEMKE